MSLAVADLVGSVDAPVVLNGGVLDARPDLLRGVLGLLWHIQEGSDSLGGSRGSGGVGRHFDDVVDLRLRKKFWFKKLFD